MTTHAIDKPLGALAGVAALLALSGGPAAHAAEPLPFSCATVNAANAGGPTAHANGYSNAFGNLSVPDTGVVPASNGDRVVALPDDGILCYKRFSGASADGGYDVTFVPSAAHTPVYIFVEDTFELGTYRFDVSGGHAEEVFAPGITRRGGIGGPGGGDGGSCDMTSGTSDERAGAGVGPGGGQGSVSYGAGGGAGPTLAGGAGYGGTAGAGGLPYAVGSQRLMFGGSGGGCGIYSNKPYGGGGGGGVIVIAAGTRLDVGASSVAGIFARGGSGVDLLGSSTNRLAGGGGGGGVIRLVTPVVTGEGVLDVRGGGPSLQSATCGTSSGYYYGGCGGPGVVKLEAYRVEPQVVAQIGTTNGGASAVYSEPQALVLPPAVAPTVVIHQVTAAFEGVSASQTPGAVDPARHLHEQPSLNLQEGQVVTVEVHTTHVASTDAVQVRVNTVSTDPGLAPGHAGDQVVTATHTGGAGVNREWTAVLTLPAGLRMGTVEAWVEAVCLPGTLGCPAVE